MDVLEQLMRSAEQAEVVRVHRESTSVVFEASRLKRSQVKETSGLAVRVVKGGRLGFAASSDTRATARLMRNVLESAEHGDAVTFSLPAPQEALDVVTFDESIAALSIGKLVEIGQEMLDLILAAEPGVNVEIELTRSTEHLALRNHSGTDIDFRRSPLSISVEVRWVKGDDVLITYDQTGTTVWDGQHMQSAERLCRKLELARNQARLRSGRMPVLFAPNGSLVLGLPVMLGLDGKDVLKRASPMAGNLGQKLFSDKLTFVDDPTIDGKFGSSPFDDEGVSHRRNVLIDQGILKGFLYDLKTASQAGVESTGNGSRTLFTPPSPQPTNLLIEPGTVLLTDMIASIDSGLWVEDALGLGQGNVISGAFSNSLSLAYKIEKGQLVGRVKDVSIAGNVYDLLRNVAAVSSETEWVHHSLRVPYIMLDSMNVVSQQ